VFCRDTRIIEPIFMLPHKEMCDELEACLPVFGTDYQKKELYLAPRRTYKTSLVVALIIYAIVKWPNIRIGLGRATHEMAKGLLFEVTQKLRNPVILDVWGDLSKDAPIWNAERIVVNTRTRAYHEPTVDTFGLGTSLTGQHLDLILGDDFVHELNYLSAAAVRQGQITIQSFFPVLEPHGSVIITGTRWAANDLYGWLLDMDEKLEQAALAAWKEGDPEPQGVRQWRRYIRSAYTHDEDGKKVLYFPAVITERFLDQQRASIESKLFSSWYLNQPFEEGLKVFTEFAWFDCEYYAQPFPMIVRETAQGVLSTPVRVSLTIDPALMSSPSNDEMGVTVVGTDADDVWYVLHAEGFRKIPSEQASRVLYIIRHFLPKTVVCESAGADVEFMQRLALGIEDINAGLADDRRIILQGYSALRDEAKGKRGKAQRIESLEPRFRDGKVKLRRAHVGDLFRQLDSWPDCPNGHDDVIDALAMQRVCAKPALEKTIVESFDSLEELEEAASWGPDGKPVPPPVKPQGTVLARVGRSVQYLPS
jgi:hypothetical protein